MNDFLLRSIIGWGIVLWLVGYVLGFLFYMVVPPAMIGWYLMPIGCVLTCIVLWRWVPLVSHQRALAISIGWTIIAIVCDYFGIVRLLAPADGYYKLDVYLYYVLTFALPLCVYMIKRRSSRVAGV